MAPKSLIGIIGGSGSLASLDIEKKIFNHVQKKYFPAKDKDYPNLLIYQHTQFSENDSDVCFQQYLECVKILESAKVKYLLLACNSAHLYIPLLKKTIKIKMLSLINETSKSIHKSSLRITKVGLISNEKTLKSELYQMELSKYNIEVITPDKNIVKKVIQGIYFIKAGIFPDNKDIFPTKKIFKSNFFNQVPEILKNIKINTINIFDCAIKHLLSKGCNHIILGCTEIPILIKELEKLNPNCIIIDPNEVIAKVIVEKLN